MNYKEHTAVPNAVAIAGWYLGLDGDGDTGVRFVDDNQEAWYALSPSGEPTAWDSDEFQPIHRLVAEALA